MTRGRKIDRDRLAVRRLFGSGFLVALFLISGLVQQMHRGLSPAVETTARHDAESPISGDADNDPTESESESAPAEDAPPARNEAELGNVPSARLARLIASRLPDAILPDVGRASSPPPARFDRINPSPRPSGRALRDMLRSHIC